VSDTEDQTVSQAKSAPAASVGALLKATRTRLGQDIKQVAQALRIRQLFLQAIEDGRYDELPGPTYALGFVRSYADFLGLDSEEVVRRFRAETSGGAGKSDLVFPTPAVEKRLPSGPLVAAALALGVLIYGGWYAASSLHRPVAEAVPEVPDSLAKPGEGQAAEGEKKEEAAQQAAPASQPVEEVKPVEAKPEEKVEPPKVEPPKAEEPKTEAAQPKKPDPLKIEPGKTAALAPTPSALPTTSAQGMGGLAISAKPPTDPAPAKPAAAAPAAQSAAPGSAAPAATTAATTPATPPVVADDKAPKVYGQTDGEVRVVIKATSDSWIQVRDEKGNLVATRLLKKGDSYRVPTGMGKLSLTTGDAGALSALVDGVLATPSLGPSGSVRRDVALDPDRIKAGNP
jgi:cytoskeleton protein RodZ